jgi:hypothetical protein
MGGAAMNGKNGKSKLTWRVLWVSLTALFFSFVPFFGYTYLVSKLSGAGFERVDVNPKIYDLIYYAFEACINPLSKIMSASVLEFILGMLPKLFVLGLFVGFFAIIISIFMRISDSKNTDGNIEDIVDREGKAENLSFPERIGVIIKDSAYSFKSALFVIFGGLVSITIVALGEFFIFILFVTSISVFWLIGMLGSIVGYQDGKNIIEKNVCKAEANYHKAELIMCSQIFIEGVLTSGKRVYSDSEHTFFITNSGSYQINNRGETVYFKSIYKAQTTKGVNND